MHLLSIVLLFLFCFDKIEQRTIIASWQNISEYLDQLTIGPFESHLKKILQSNKIANEISENCHLSLKSFLLALESRQEWAYKSKFIFQLIL